MGGKSTRTYKRGLVPGYRDVWLNRNSPANILSLARVKEKFRVTYDSKNGNSFAVHTTKGILLFIQHPSGLYYHDLAQKGDEWSMLNSEWENKFPYSERQFKMAKLARDTMSIVGRPSDNDYVSIITTNQIKNCPVLPEGIKIAKKVFGPELGTLKGKTTRKKPIPVRQDIISIPRNIKIAHRDVVIAADVMFVNTIPFFVTISRVIKFRTSQDIPNRTKNTYLTCIKLILQVYRSAGFVV